MIRELQDMPTLNWIGKDAVVKHHKHVPYRLMALIEEFSDQSGDYAIVEGKSSNFILQDHNLHTPKRLMWKLDGGLLA